MLTTSRWQQRLYPPNRSYDPVEHFVDELYKHVDSESTVLDIGAGAGQNNPYQLQGKCREIVGVDLDSRVLTNSLLDRGIVSDVLHLPFENQSFNIAFSIYVLEHIQDPNAFIREIHRVLKPGGMFFALTPNYWHYVPLIASCTPYSFHRWYNEKRGRASDDTFPTYYRMNTRRTLRKQFQQMGFDEKNMKLIEVQPNYLNFCLPTFLAGALYERVVNSTELLAGFRVNIVCGYRKL